MNKLIFILLLAISCNSFAENYEQKTKQQEINIYQVMSTNVGSCPDNDPIKMQISNYCKPVKNKNPSSTKPNKEENKK
jgi:hypothetical protein